MLAVVLAAGRGNRLLPLTNHRSKAMMPVAGKPMIARVLDMLEEGGVERAIVVAHPSDLGLIDYLARSSWAARCQLVYQEQRLGMAHALECASPLLRETGVSEFLLASCDNLCPEGHVAKLVARHRERDIEATLTLMWTPGEEATASAVVVLRDGLVADIIEKPDLEEIPFCNEHGETLSAPPLYALSSRVLDYLPRVPLSRRGEREFPDALRLMIADNGDVGGQMMGKRMTLTNPQDLLALNRHFLQSDPACAVVEAEIPADVAILPPVRIAREASVASGCQIGPDAYLEGGSRVGAEAIVHRSIVMHGGSVKPKCVVDDAVISRVGEAT